MNQNTPVPGYHPFQVGSFACVSLYDGFHDYQHEQMFTNASRHAVEEALQAHGWLTSTVQTPFTYLVVNTGQHQILVDTGAGDSFPTTGNLLQNMKAAGIEPEQIDSVFITHAHPDHVGGLVDGNGEPVFSHATHFICKTEWDFWFSDQAAVQAGEWMTAFAREKLTPIKNHIIQLEREGNIFPGVGVLFTPGHTPGHMSISFSSKNARLLYSADAALHPLHLEHPDWLPVFDILPEAAEVSKRRLFDLAAATKSLVLGQHFPPFPSLGQVFKRDIGWEWQFNLLDCSPGWPTSRAPNS